MAISDLLDLCNDIATTLGAAASINRVQGPAALSEDSPDLPMLQCYPVSGDTDAGNTASAGSGANDRTTFRAGVRVTETLLRVDIPCRQRSHLAEDMAAVVGIAQEVQDLLEAQKTKPYFGNATIKGFRWRWEYVNFQRGQQEIVYPGCRFDIYVRQF